jgi:hypothetical protein
MNNTQPTWQDTQAMTLHNALSDAYFKEDISRDSMGRKNADPARLARLESLMKRAADRWRRRMGYKQIYR